MTGSRWPSGPDGDPLDRPGTEQRVQRAFDEVVARHERQVDMAGALVRASTQRDRRRTQRRLRLVSIAAIAAVVLLTFVGAIDLIGQSENDHGDDSREIAVEAAVTMPKNRPTTTSPPITEPAVPQPSVTPTSCLRAAKTLPVEELAPPEASVLEGFAPQETNTDEPLAFARFWVQGDTTLEVTIPAAQPLPLFADFAVQGRTAFLRPATDLSALWVSSDDCLVGVRAWNATAPDTGAVAAYTTGLRIIPFSSATGLSASCPPDEPEPDALEPLDTLRLLYFTCSFDDLGVEDPFPVPWHPNHPSPPSAHEAVQALVRGTPQGYFSAFPLYVSGSRPSVTIAEGVATVDLDFDDPALENDLLADADLQDLLLDQLAAVLFQFDGIDEVDATPLCCEGLRVTRSTFVAESDWFRTT